MSTFLDGSTYRKPFINSINLCIVVLWVVLPCRLVGVHQHFRGTYCHHLQSSMMPCSVVAILQMVVIHSSKTLVTTCEITWHHNSEDGTPHSHCHVNLKSKKITYSEISNNNK
jgi:hypothetical protein